MICDLVFIVSLDSSPITGDFNFFSIGPQFDIQSRIHSMYVPSEITRNDEIIGEKLRWTTDFHIETN